MGFRSLILCERRFGIAAAIQAKLTSVSLLNTRLIATRGAEKGHVVIKYGRIMAIALVRE